MRNLVLLSVCKHPDYGHLVCAYITYGSKDVPVDHKGEAIGFFGRFPVKFMDHLSDEVLPLLNLEFKDSAYRAREVDVLDQATIPFVIIECTNGVTITKNDVQKISKLLSKAIVRINQNRMKTDTYSGFFSDKHKSDDVKEPDKSEPKLTHR